MKKAYLTKHTAMTHTNEYANSSTQNSSPNSSMEIDPIISVEAEEVEEEESEDVSEKEYDDFEGVQEIKFESVEKEIMKTKEENNIEIDKGKDHFRKKGIFGSLQNRLHNTYALYFWYGEKYCYFLLPYGMVHSMDSIPKIYCVGCV